MRKQLLIGALAASLPIMALFVALPAKTQTQPAYASDKEIIQSDPYRPSFDLWGNEWSYDGKLIHAACPNKPDPISHKDNPECPKTTPPASKPVPNKPNYCGGK